MALVPRGVYQQLSISQEGMSGRRRGRWGGGIRVGGFVPRCEIRRGVRPCEIGVCADCVKIARKIRGGD